MPSQYVNLMSKDQDLGCQRGPRSDQRRPDQAASFSHKIETLRDSASLASRIRFPTGTTKLVAQSALQRYRTTNQRVTLLLLQPVDRLSTGSVGRAFVRGSWLRKRQRCRG